MRIIACRFQRSKDVDAEDGIAVVDYSGNTRSVIDSKAEYVPDIWGLKLCHHLFNVHYAE